MRVSLLILVLGSLVWLSAEVPATDDPVEFESPAARAWRTGFEANRGQADSRARFLSRRAAMTAFFTDEGFVLRMREPATGAVASLFMTFEGREPRVTPRPFGDVLGSTNVYRGRNGWFEDIPRHASLRYEGIYEGIDVVVREHDGLEYDLLLAPGAELNQVVLRCEGATSLRVELGAFGERLLVETAAGTLIQDIPACWEELDDGARRAVTAHFRILDEHRFGFQVPDRDSTRPLVIDPGLAYASYLGGTLRDRANAVALGADGHVYLAGMTGSDDFPVTAGTAQGVLAGLADAFVARLDLETGTVVYATYLGGTDNDFLKQENAVGLALVGEDAIIAGSANADDFPTTAGAAFEVRAGGEDGFVARLSGTGQLLWSTMVGGSLDDRPLGLDVDGAGNVFVVGRTSSDDYPTTAGALQETFQSIFFTTDAFVTKLAAAGDQLLYSTYLAGTVRDEAHGVDVDALGAATVTGLTGSSDFPTSAGAYDETFNGPSGSQEDAFVLRLTPAGDALEYGTYVGGVEQAEGRQVVVDASGAATVAGITQTADFPTTPGSLQETYGGGAADAFVLRLLPDGSDLVFSTMLGGSGTEEALAVALAPDGTGAVTVAGWSDSPDFPVSDGSTSAGGRDAFLVRLDTSGAQLLYGSLLGGIANDEAAALVLDVQGGAYVAGETDSADLPVSPGAVDGAYDGGGDAWLARFDLPPWADTGSAKAGTGGQQPRLLGTGSLAAGTPGALLLSDALPSTLAILFIGFAQGDVPFKGGTLVPFPFFLDLNLFTFPDGTLVAPWAAWPAGLPSGFQLYFQVWLSDPGAPQNASASNGVEATTP